MRRRCSNPKHISYKNYGGRGIRVCKEWEDFKTFARDMGPKPKGTSIERINNDGNYEPGNCRWATMVEQLSNRRPGSLGTPRLITYRDETLCISDWARKVGITPKRLIRRLNRGLPLSEALAS
jgi:hypothetical protein